MKLKRKKRKILIDGLTVIAFIVAVFGTYFGLRIFLATDMPLAAVTSGSMRPNLEVGDLIIVQGVPATNIQPEDIIVFNPPEGRGYTVHRVVKTQAFANGTIQFKTKGDDNDSEDPYWVPNQNVHGRILYRIPYLGYIALDPTIPIILTITIATAILLWPEKHKKKFRHKPRST